MPNTNGRVSIIGAGFSGLTLAFELRKCGVPVTVYESSHRTGGLISSTRTDDGLVETAANGLLANAAVERLVQELNLEALPHKRNSKRRFIFRLKPRRWPLGMMETITLGWKAFLFWLDPSCRRPRAEESVSDWITRIFSRATHDYLVSPALQGIYAGDTRKMSAHLLHQAMFPAARLPRAENLRGTFAFRNGMQELTDALTSNLETNAVKILRNQRLSAGEIQTLIAQGEAVVFCCGPKVAAKYFLEIGGEDSDPQSAASQLSSGESSNDKRLPNRSSQLCRDYALHLKNINLIPLTTVTVFFDSRPEDIPHSQPEGFGILFPEDQEFAVLGVLMNSFVFDFRGHCYSETWILGGARFPDLHLQSDGEIMAIIRESRKRAMTTELMVKSFAVTRWPEGIPHYDLALEKFLSIYRQEYPIYLHGNYLGKLGLSRIYQSSIDLAAKIKNDMKNK